MNFQIYLGCITLFRCDLQSQKVEYICIHNVTLHLQALNRHQSTFKKHHESGVHQEEKFLEETAQREENYQSSISELEQDLKTSRAHMTRVAGENERLSTLIADLNHQVSLIIYVYL